MAGGAVGAGRGCWPNGGANNERTYARDDVRTYKGNERGNIWARGARQGSIKDDDVFQFPYKVFTLQEQARTYLHWRCQDFIQLASANCW